MKNNKWYLYIIRTKLNSLYTGITTDVDRRFESHKNGKGAKYLRGKAPLSLEFSTFIGNKSEASKAEIKVKKLSKLQKEQLIINNPNILVDYLSKIKKINS